MVRLLTSTAEIRPIFQITQTHINLKEVARVTIYYELKKGQS